MIKVGISITCTSSRFNLVEQSLKFLTKFNSFQYIISVFCDQNLNNTDLNRFNKFKELFPTVSFNNEYVKSIAKAKNKSLKPLVQQNCDFYFLLDDDCIIVNQLGIKYYIQACKDYHFLHLHLPNFRATLKDKQNLIKQYQNFKILSYAYDTGVCLCFDKYVINTVHRI